MVCNHSDTGMKRGPVAPANFHVVKNQYLSDLRSCEDALHKKKKQHPCGNIKWLSIIFWIAEGEPEEEGKCK